jgi:hypothetical protein
MAKSFLISLLAIGIVQVAFGAFPGFPSGVPVNIKDKNGRCLLSAAWSAPIVNPSVDVVGYAETASTTYLLTADDCGYDGVQVPIPQSNYIQTENVGSGLLYTQDATISLSAVWVLESPYNPTVPGTQSKFGPVRMISSQGACISPKGTTPYFSDFFGNSEVIMSINSDLSQTALITFKCDAANTNMRFFIMPNIEGDSVWYELTNTQNRQSLSSSNQEEFQILEVQNGGRRDNATVSEDFMTKLLDGLAAAKNSRETP